jgi:hypothetical protein
MSHKSWFYLGISFGVVRSNWIHSKTRTRITQEEKKDVQGEFDKIEDNVLEEYNWKEEDIHSCIFALQELKLKLFKLQKKYSITEDYFSP